MPEKHQRILSPSLSICRAALRRNVKFKEPGTWPTESLTQALHKGANIPASLGTLGFRCLLQGLSSAVSAPKSVAVAPRTRASPSQKSLSAKSLSPSVSGSNSCVPETVPQQQGEKPYQHRRRHLQRPLCRGLHPVDVTGKLQATV